MTWAIVWRLIAIAIGIAIIRAYPDNMLAAAIGIGAMLSIFQRSPPPPGVKVKRTGPYKTRHWLHALLSVITGGLWLVIWAIVAITNTLRNKAQNV